jgi:hypothetical protein
MKFAGTSTSLIRRPLVRPTPWRKVTRNHESALGKGEDFRGAIVGRVYGSGGRSLAGPRGRLTIGKM